MNEFNYRDSGASGSSGIDGHSDAGSSTSQSGAGSTTGGRVEPGGAGGASAGRAAQAGAESGGDTGGGGEGGDNGEGGHRAGRAGNGESGQNAAGTSGSGAGNTSGGTSGATSGGTAGTGASGGAPMPEPGELTFGRPASASTEEISKGNVAGKANDFDTRSRWCASDGSLPQWWQVDLGSVRSLARMEVTWEFARQYGYVVEVSEDGTEFTTILDNTANAKTDPVQTETLDCEGRYVRIRFTYLPPPPSITWACLVELRLFEM